MRKADDLRYVVTLANGEVHEFRTYREIADFLKVSEFSVRKAVLNQPNHLTEQGIKVSKWEDYYKVKPVREHKIIKERLMAHHPITVHMLDKFTHEILKTFSSVKEATEYLGGVDDGSIRLCARGKIRVAHGYKWEFEIETIKELDFNYKTQGEVRYVVYYKDKTVYFSTITEIGRHFGVDKSLITATVHGQRTALTRRGILIYTIAEWEGLEPVRAHEYGKCRAKGGGKRPVRMIDRYTHEILDEFGSIREALEDLGKEHASGGLISCACRTPNRTAYGYKWEYVN